MSRIAIFLYGVISYLIFFAVFLYGIGFIGGFLTPTTLDSPPHSSLGWALSIDLGLLAAFAVQHSGMARPGFKRWWTRIVPEEIERSTYVLVSSLALVVLYVFWEPIGGVIEVSSNVAASTACFGSTGIKPRISGSSRSLAPPKSNRTVSGSIASALATLA